MCFLSPFVFTPIPPGSRVEKSFAVVRYDPASGGVDCLFAQMDRVGPHIGNVSVLIEFLSDLHGQTRTQIQFPVGFNLQRGGCEWGIGVSKYGFLLNVGDPPGTGL